jgi:hypothetical protein
VDPRWYGTGEETGDPLYHFPTGSRVNLTWDEDGEIIATGLTIENRRFWSIADIVKLGLINERGGLALAPLFSHRHGAPASLSRLPQAPLRRHGGWKATPVTNKDAGGETSGSRLCARRVSYLCQGPGPVSRQKLKSPCF